MVHANPRCELGVAEVPLDEMRRPQGVGVGSEVGLFLLCKGRFLPGATPELSNIMQKRSCGNSLDERIHRIDPTCPSAPGITCNYPRTVI